MVATSPQPATVPAPTNGDSDALDHIYCCDDTRAYCGTDITNHVERQWDEPIPHPCVVCDDISDSGATCPTCGEAL